MAEDMEGLEAKERQFFQLNTTFCELEEKGEKISEKMEKLESEQKKLKIELEKKNANRNWLVSLEKSNLDAEARKFLDGLIAENDPAENEKRLAAIEENISKLKTEDAQLKEKLHQVEQREKVLHMSLQENNTTRSPPNQQSTNSPSTPSQTNSPSKPNEEVRIIKSSYYNKLL